MPEDGDPVTDQTPTTRGIHMGLGPTWVILSLINSYSAWKAGAGRTSYSVCGDDLIGFWARPIADRYEATLEELGLVVNKTKSFFGRRGVFCERIVEQDSRGTRADAHDVGHLSAITAAKLIARQTDNQFAVAANLKDNTVQKDLSDQVRKYLIPSKTGPGRVEHGGNGFGRLSRGKMALLVKEGAPNLAVSRDESTSALLKELKATAVQGHVKREDPMTMSDAVIAIKSASQTCHYLRNEKLETLPISKRSWIQRDRRSKSLDKITDDHFRELIRNSQLNSKNKKCALHILSKNCHLKSIDKHRRLESILSRSVSEQLVERSSVINLIQKHLSIDWSEYVKKKKVDRVKAPSVTARKGGGLEDCSSDIDIRKEIEAEEPPPNFISLDSGFIPLPLNTASVEPKNEKNIFLRPATGRTELEESVKGAKGTINEQFYLLAKKQQDEDSYDLNILDSTEERQAL